MTQPWIFLSLAGALLAIGWGVGRFMYSERITLLNDRLTKRDERIAELERGGHPGAAPMLGRDPNAIYQHGEPVAAAVKAHIDRGAGLVTFDAANGNGALDLTNEFEFQDWRLAYQSRGDINEISFGTMRNQQILKLVAKIVGKRT